MSKPKVLKFTKKDILEAAKAKALSYFSRAKKQKPLTAKEKRVLAIYEAASAIGECQTEPVLKLMDLLTGLPVSKAGALPSPKARFRITPDGNITLAWQRENPLMVIWATGTSHFSVNLGANGSLLNNMGQLTSENEKGFVYHNADKNQINKFFDGLPEVAINLLASGLVKE